MNLKKFFSGVTVASLLAQTFTVSLLSSAVFVTAEGSMVAATTSTDANVTLSVTSGVSLSCNTSTVALGSIDGFNGGNASNHGLVCNVKTNDTAGYTLSIDSSGSPAMQGSSDDFADFSTTTAFNFSVGSAESKFAFSVSSTDAALAFLNDSADCGTGAVSSYNNCFSGFDSGNDVTVSASNAATDSNGTDTTFNFTAGIGATRNQTSGNYNATTTITATTN